MATLTIRKIPDEQIQQLKEVAEKNNRSMESQVRSILEEWLAGTVAHEITRKTNFYDEIREFMKNMDFEGLDKGELPLSERNSTAITVAELLAGICRMPEGKRRKYTDTTVKLALMTLEDRTFAFDTQAAADYAHILVEREHRGTPTSIQDAMIAAIACSWDAAIATRNIKDFEGTDVELINPWEFA